ncbi:ABC transporter ATP-binding protein [Rossellomorea aquimaris]|uniref:ABC-2 type transport system ATP-binding protein n=1 Tax=Rossellomorea aquimaris TaxID=189382 RepID=A0A366EJ77_9BACI|nr:ABC transporter ATP-binding protein [Rossellomorea aquimaris]RBP02477.1 ABC-2 type transport system ATP-binding protein [Rossellomorea aquimaris]
MGLELRNINKIFGDFVAIENLSIHAGDNRIFGLIGQNGAGKTTTFRMVLGLLKPDKGEIIWNGKKVRSIDPDQIGYLPEERGLYQDLSLEDQLLFFGRLRGKNRKELLPKINYWLDRLELSDKRTQKVKTLSKGNQQKLQLISTILHEPSILILDEPFSGLDPVNAESLKDIVLELRDTGTTIIFSSHRMEHVEEMCDDICMLRAGRSILQGDIYQVKKQFGTKKVILKSNHKEEELNMLPYVSSVKKELDKLNIYVHHDRDIEKIFDYVTKDGFVSTFSAETPSLNEIFKMKVGELSV